MADGSVNEDVVITRPFGDGKITCREIRRNSAGCLRFRNECEKCKEIQHVGEMVSGSGCKKWNHKDTFLLMEQENCLEVRS